MKTKDVPVLKQKVLAVLPIKQSELWKILNIDHRDVSELVGIMVKEQLVKKTKIAHTFLIESPNGDKKKKDKDLTPLISGSGKFSPCSGCSDECSPAECKKLTEWVLDVEKKVEKEEKRESELKNESEKSEIEQIKNHEKLIKDIKDEKDNTINKKSVKHRISIKKIRKDIENRNKNLIKA